MIPYGCDVYCRVSQKAVSAYFTSKQILPFGFVEKCGHSPADTKHLYNICTTTAQHFRRWSSIVQMLYKCFVSAGSFGLRTLAASVSLSHHAFTYIDTTLARPAITDSTRGPREAWTGMTCTAHFESKR